MTPPPPAASDVRVAALCKSFGDVVAVRDVDFELAPGHLLALLGPSGCGKTTTLRIIAGLVRPDAGSVFLKDRDVTRTPVHRRNVGMLFQNYALFPHLTVAENVAFGLEMRGIGRSETRRMVAEALKMVQLEGLEERLPQQLSGGQQQRTALARALVIEPFVLLLDEPFGALDKRLREVMQIEMRALQERLGVTTIIVTHDQEEALTLANVIAVMRDGRIEQTGSPSEIYNRPVSRFVADFIGTSNFFRGRVVGSDGGHLRIEAGDGLVVWAAATGASPPDGALVTVALRPENIRFEGAAENGANRAAARLERVVYRGLMSHYHLRRPDGSPIIVVRQGTVAEAPPELTADRLVGVSWEPSAARIVRDD